MLVCGLDEQGDLDAVVDVELVQQAGDVGLDGRDGEVQSCGDVAVVTTQPGSKSQQNVQRRGFDLLSARAILVRRP